MSGKRQRRRRDVRRKKAARLVLRERDVDIVEAVYRFRLLRQDQLQTLFFGSKTRAQVRLEKLYDHGFLDRKFLPVALGEGRSPTLYVLDRRGAELLRVERGYDDLSGYTTRRTLKTDFIEHTLAINDVMVAVTAACRQQAFTLEQWQTESQLKADYDRVTIADGRGKPQHVAVVPDSYFTIIANGRRYPFFLELDRGTMTLKRFKTKVEAYLAYINTGAYQKRYQTRSVRVLTVTLSAVRMANLKQATEAVGDTLWFWFGVLPTLKPETILTGAAWYQAGKREQQALITSSQYQP